MIEYLDAPPPGFPVYEYERRLEVAQQCLHRDGLDALLVTTPQQVRYFTGFDTQFWESPTRPWYVVVPRTGVPSAVVPEIGAPGMRATWISDVRTWPAPDPADDGLSVLAATLHEAAGATGTVGAELGREFHLRMPIVEWEELVRRTGLTFVDGSPAIRTCRHVKSELEIDKIRYVCRVVSDGYAKVPRFVGDGATEHSVVQRLRCELIAGGADHSPYLIGVAGAGGYDNIVMGPTGRPLRHGDVFTIDTGTVVDGYFCDFNRNWAIGTAGDAVRRAYDAVWRATNAGLDAARPGVPARAVWRAMFDVLSEAGTLGNNVGRLGHGLGLQLTEAPSNHPMDETVLEAGTVLTLEPGMEFAPGRMMVHEEDIVVRPGEPEVLSVRAAPELPVVG